MFFTKIGSHSGKSDYRFGISVVASTKFFFALRETPLRVYAFSLLVHQFDSTREIRLSKLRSGLSRSLLLIHLADRQTKIFSQQKKETESLLRTTNSTC